MSESNPHAFFEADWLSLREPADHQARAMPLTDAAAEWLARQAASRRRIVDLGAGRGSNMRYLAPRLPGPQHWRLIDHDCALLETVQASAHSLTDAHGAPVAIETQALDLTGDGLEAALAGSHLVTAAALFDLVTRAWIVRLAQACAAHAAAVLFVLSIDGHIDFAPASTDDAFITGLLGAHQHRDKSFGEALGAHAPAVLQQAFEHEGYRATLAKSAWYIDATRADLGAALIDGWRGAACEQAPEARARINAWAAARTQSLQAGELSLTVGHQDLFATPSP